MEQINLKNKLIFARVRPGHEQRNYKRARQDPGRSMNRENRNGPGRTLAEILNFPPGLVISLIAVPDPVLEIPDRADLYMHPVRKNSKKISTSR